jgi:hypothetical protein
MKLIRGTLVVSLVVQGYLALGASAVGRMSMTVVPNLSVGAVEEMRFAPAPQGAPESSISPDDGSKCGTFRVQGAPNASYQIRLPSDSTLTTGSGTSAQEKIVIRNFQANVGSTGSLDNNGNQEICIGATRESLVPDQAVGTYLGSYTVEVIY